MATLRHVHLLPIAHEMRSCNNRHFFVCLRGRYPWQPGQPLRIQRMPDTSHVGAPVRRECTRRNKGIALNERSWGRCGVFTFRLLPWPRRLLRWILRRQKTTEQQVIHAQLPDRADDQQGEQQPPLEVILQRGR